MSDEIFRIFNDITELAEYFKIDILPQAEALIPINPIRWPAHAAGSILGQDLQNADSLVAKPFTNLATTKQYLATAHNRSHFYSRAREVGMDTLDVNALSEWSVVGNAASGTYANWAANKYRIKMEVDDNRLPSNSTVFTDRRKKKIASNAQKREKAITKAVAKANPTIGNAPKGQSPTVGQFSRNSTRSVWSRKFFSRNFRGGHQNFVVEVPTNQTHLHNKQEAINFIYSDYIFTIILIFVMLTQKTFSRFRRVRKKLADILSKIKTKFKRKNKFT